MTTDPIFQPLVFPNLVVKNRTPHPRMPPGAFPSAEMTDTYCAMIAFGKNVRFIHRLTSSRWTRWLD
jgi:hypothetical protein